AAAAAAGSAIRSVQVDFIQFDFIQVDFIFTSPSSFSRQALCQSCGQTKSRVMDATAAQRYRRLRNDIEDWHRQPKPVASPSHDSESWLRLRRWLRIIAPDDGASPCGGTGRRARLKIVFRKECGFDSLHGHHEGKSALK